MLPKVMREGDTGTGICNIHGVVSITLTKANQSTVYANGKLVCVIGSEGVGSCGDHIVATTGSPNVFIEGKAVHRVTDTGIFDIVGGTFTSEHGSPNVTAN